MHGLGPVPPGVVDRCGRARHVPSPITGALRRLRYATRTQLPFAISAGFGPDAPARDYIYVIPSG